MTITDKYIDPFTDFGFKHIFGTEENKRFLISFLNDLLDIDDDIVDIEYRNLEKLGLNIVDRKAIFDVYCTDEKDNNFIVELQRSKQEYFKDRSIYYTSFPIQEQSRKGFWDYRLKKIYFIEILEFVMDKEEKSKEEDDYLSIVQLCNIKKREVFFDKLTYYYLEMPKFRKTEKEISTHLDYWLWYLNNLAKTTTIPEKLENDELIKDAFDVAEFLALDKDRQFAYQLNLKARLDYLNVMNYAKKEARLEGREKGREEGIEEGEKKAKIEIAKNLILANMDTEFILKTTGLDKKTVDNLRN
jgi:predicted transposase/invertase (TIGR01784 family)